MKKKNFCYLFFYRNILRSVTEILDLTQELSVLDVGCGPAVWIMVRI